MNSAMTMSFTHELAVELASQISDADMADLLTAADDEDPREYVDVILKVSERRFAAWPRHIRQVFEPARTVQAGAQSFRLTTDSAGDA